MRQICRYHWNVQIQKTDLYTDNFLRKKKNILQNFFEKKINKYSDFLKSKKIKPESNHIIVTYKKKKIIKHIYAACCSTLEFEIHVYAAHHTKHKTQVYVMYS